MPAIHLVDDEAEFCGLLRELVESLGMTCRTYSSASVFLRGWGGVEAGDLIILDLMMPVMDGVELMRSLAERDCQQGLILITGGDAGILHSAEVLARAQGLQLVKTLTKPIDLNQFASLLLRHAGHTLDHDRRQQATDGRWIEFDAAELEQGIRAGQMILYYQPQVEIATGRLVGVEALVRWLHPRFGLLGPDRFIPRMEQLGIVELLTHEVIRVAVERQRSWSRDRFPLNVSVNISARDTNSLGLPDQLAALLAMHRLDPECITLEITETSLINEQVRSLDMLTRLRLKGIRLSIDDFGTGFSSFLQLFRAPFGELKIDRTFVSRMNHDREAMTIVEICVELARKLKMRTVAEGVEDRATLQMLSALGCQRAQGYHIARPMPEAELLAWIRERDRPAISAIPRSAGSDPGNGPDGSES